jgi:beta-glucosidase
MVHGRPYAIAWEKAHLPAILETWYPGEEGGRAVANILFGITNPSGRLSMSIPQSVGHVPVYYSHKPSGRGYYRDPGSPEKPGHDYVFASTEPLFSFGYGLSYTTFRYDDLQVERDRYREGDTVRVTVTLTNTGSRHGKEVVQLYLNDKVSSTTTPVRRLVRFQKVALGKGESRRITFTLHRDDFTLWNRNMEEVVEPGEFEIMIGRSADDMVLSREITYGDS